MKLEPEDAEELEEKLHEHDELTHLCVKVRGDKLVIYSGDANDPQKHARLTDIGRGIWGLSLPRHTGRWEPTPFTGTIEEILDTLVSNFSFYLEK